MNKCLIIAGFAGIGKTTLAEKYKNVYDLESSPYKWDNTGYEDLSIEQRKGTTRKENELWPQNYLSEIKSKSLIYDILLVWVHPDVLDLYDNENIEYVICYPCKQALEEYRQRYINRGNNENYINRVIDSYDFRVKQWNEYPNEKIILNCNETLEDYLLNNNYKLIEK